jgi:hypothetical protein
MEICAVWFKLRGSVERICARSKATSRRSNCLLRLGASTLIGAGLRARCDRYVWFITSEFGPLDILYQCSSQILV